MPARCRPTPGSGSRSAARPTVRPAISRPNRATTTSAPSASRADSGRHPTTCLEAPGARPRRAILDARARESLDTRRLSMEWQEKGEVKKEKIHNLFRCGYLDVREWLEETDVVLIPLGSTEQHGRHLPVCTDSIATELPCMLAAELADVPYYQLIPLDRKST